MLPIGAPNGGLLLSEIRIMDLDLDECVCVHGVWVVGVVGWCGVVCCVERERCGNWN